MSPRITLNSSQKLVNNFGKEFRSHAKEYTSEQGDKFESEKFATVSSSALSLLS
jgi:hypothetical protein